jgi:hypothetical protein
MWASLSHLISRRAQESAGHRRRGLRRLVFRSGPASAWRRRRVIVDEMNDYYDVMMTLWELYLNLICFDL